MVGSHLGRWLAKVLQTSVKHAAPTKELFRRLKCDDPTQGSGRKPLRPDMR